VQPIISIEGLSKTYAGGFQALKNVDLEIRKGEIFALLGPNGAGKTTLIGITCGIVNPTSGRVLADGHDVVRDYRAARSKIGLVPQELSTDAFERVWATVNFSRGLFGKRPDPAYLEKVLRDLSLWDKKDAKIMALSGGMKRRVMIAKALSHEPQILFLDEPTAGVDVELRRDMWRLVRDLRATGVGGKGGHPMATQGGLPAINDIRVTDPFRWLGRAWLDLWRAPLPLLTYGLLLAAASAALAYGIYVTNAAFWVLALTFGFVFVAPVLAMGPYEAGRRLEIGQRPKLADILLVRTALRQDVAYLGLALLLIYFLWGRIAQVVYGLSTYQLYHTAPEFIEFALRTPEGHNMLMAGSVLSMDDIAASRFILE